MSEYMNEELLAELPVRFHKALVEFGYTKLPLQDVKDITTDLLSGKGVRDLPASGSLVHRMFIQTWLKELKLLP